MEYRGTATLATINNGGTQEVAVSRVHQQTTVSSGGLLYSFGGFTFSATVSNSGLEHVQGGEASNTIVGSGGTELVTGNGEAFGTVVDSGGYAVVLSSAMPASVAPRSAAAASRCCPAATASPA